jgi:hypothetical protein
MVSYLGSFDLRQDMGGLIWIVESPTRPKESEYTEDSEWGFPYCLGFIKFYLLID